MLVGKGVLSVDKEAFDDALREAPALPSVENRLLQVGHVATGGIDHAEAPEGFGGGDVGGHVALHGHEEGVFAALVEVEHAVGEAALHGEGEVDAVARESILHLIVVGPADNLVPTLLPHEVILPQEFILILVVAYRDGKESQDEDA